MKPDEVEANRQAAKKILCTVLGTTNAERLIPLINEDDALLAECLELTHRRAGPDSILKWVQGKVELTEANSQAYRFCEAVLNLSIRRDRPHQ
jgi:hypothetical protein